MPGRKGQTLILGDRAVLSVPGNYQPVHFQDTSGVIMLGILAGILLIGWMRSEARYRMLLTQKAVKYESHQINPG